MYIAMRNPNSPIHVLIPLQGGFTMKIEIKDKLNITVSPEFVAATGELISALAQLIAALHLAGII